MLLLMFEEIMVSFFNQIKKNKNSNRYYAISFYVLCFGKKCFEYLDTWILLVVVVQTIQKN